ncbi:hypothetical protein D9M68_630750 [compost metagenome]
MPGRTGRPARRRPGYAHGAGQPRRPPRVPRPDGHAGGHRGPGRRPPRHGNGRAGGLCGNAAPGTHDEPLPRRQPGECHAAQRGPGPGSGAARAGRGVAARCRAVPAQRGRFRYHGGGVPRLVLRPAGCPRARAGRPSPRTPAGGFPRRVDRPRDRPGRPEPPGHAHRPGGRGQTAHPAGGPARARTTRPAPRHGQWRW